MNFDSYIGYLEKKTSRANKSEHMGGSEGQSTAVSGANKSKYIMEFEVLNTTTSSIYDLEGHDVLIILKDGTNLTSWDDVKSKLDVKYVSEDLSGYSDLSRKYSGLISLKAIVVSEAPAYLLTTESMFYSCSSLEDISSLKNLDVSDTRVMKAMFHGCKSIEDFSALKDWDVGNVLHMEGMFNSCRSFSNLDDLRKWDVSKVVSMNHMFYGCWSLKCLDALRNWDVSNVENMEWMFSGCESLVNLNGLENWNVRLLRFLRYMFMGCVALVDSSAVNGWNVGFAARYVFYCCSSLKEAPDWCIDF